MIQELIDLTILVCCATDPLDDIAFAIFAVAWVPTRHFLMLSILVSIVKISPRVMSCGATLSEVVTGAMVERCPATWDYTTGYYWNGEVMIPICEIPVFQICAARELSHCAGLYYLWPPF